jgi:hypothetical protein
MRSLSTLLVHLGVQHLLAAHGAQALAVRTVVAVQPLLVQYRLAQLAGAGGLAVRLVPAGVRQGGGGASALLLLLLLLLRDVCVMGCGGQGVAWSFGW